MNLDIHRQQSTLADRMSHRHQQGDIRSVNQGSQSTLPISLFQSGQLLAIDPNCRGGLILQRSFYADLIGPGSAVGGYFDVKCKSVYLLGNVQFYDPVTYEDRRRAVQQRVSCIKKQQSIVLIPNAVERAEMTIDLLCRWLGKVEAQKIPHELVSQLAGVLSKTTTRAWQLYMAK